MTQIIITYYLLNFFLQAVQL